MGVEEITKWPHIENLNKCAEIMAAPCVWITEKIDGFNARFGRTAEGVFWIGTRNRLIEMNPVTETLNGFSEWALAQAPSVGLGVTVYGEWAGKGIQGRIDYGEPSFWLFGGSFNGTPFGPEDIQTQEKARKAYDFTWHVVPTLHLGPCPSITELDQMRRAPGIAGDLREGIVISPWPPIYNKSGGRLIAKYKNPAFEERTSQRTDKPITDISDALAFVAEYVNAERLGHVAQQLAEQGLDPYDIHNTRELINAMIADVYREGKEDYEKMPIDQRKAANGAIGREAKSLMDRVREERAFGTPDKAA